MHDWMPGMGGGMVLLFMIVFWILVILGIVYLVKTLMSHGSERAASQKRESALEILKKRYASG
ncbi:MAG: hypothetical protein KC643_33610 [Nitrospira sp.]|nr:hypothetical protein [Nitrospira sp.]